MKEPYGEWTNEIQKDTPVHTMKLLPGVQWKSKMTLQFVPWNWYQEVFPDQVNLDICYICY